MGKHRHSKDKLFVTNG
jgi:hypothetical protein